MEKNVAKELENAKGFVIAVITDEGTVGTYTSDSLSFIEKLGLAQVILSDVQAEANGLIELDENEEISE